MPQSPLPRPRKGETEDAFVSRCMADGTMRREYPDEDQRAGVCHSQWDRSKKGTKSKHQARRVVAAVIDTPWAILPAKLEEIVELLNLRAEGLTFTKEEIRARIDAEDSIAATIEAAETEAGYLLTQKGVAVIPIEGVLAPKMNLLMQISGGTSTQQLAAQVRAAAADQEVRAIILAVDSPGGSAIGMEEAAAAIRAAREQKPVVAVATGMMASGAYYLGSAAGEVVAGEDTLVGSIGVVMLHRETSKRDEQFGIKYTVTTAGKYKWANHSYAPLSEKGRQVQEELVNDFYKQFIGSVSKSRGLPAERIVSEYGEGKVLIGTRAKEAGLVDRIGTLTDEIAQWENAIGSRSSAGSPFHAEEKPMDPKVLSALQKLGLIEEETDEAIAQAVLTAVFKARGKPVPKTPAQIVLELNQTNQATEEPAGEMTPKTSAKADEGGTEVADREAQQKAALDERNRIREIEARGKLLGVDEETITEAIEEGISLDRFLRNVTKAKAKKERPLGRTQAGEASQDKFGHMVSDALALRCDLPVQQPAQDAGQWQYRSLLAIAEESLRIQGIRPEVDPQAMAIQALAAGGFAPVVIHGIQGAAPAQTPGSLPALLSGLANKILAEPDEESESTFREWCQQIDDVPDFKPKTIHAVGQFGELPYHVPDDTFEQTTLSEEAAWIQVDEYGDEFKLGPVMILNDDLGALTDILPEKRQAHDATLNRLCVNILTGNPTLWWDGNALFDDTNHGNDVAGGSGGVPSTAQLKLMRKKMRKQKGVGGKRALNYTVRHIVVPTDLETDTEKTLRADLNIVPTSESTDANLFRGKVTWSVEPMLDDHSTAIWYVFAGKRGKAIVFCFQKGYRGMRVVRYFQNETQTIVFQCSGRFAAAPRNYRAVGRNAGS